MEISATEAMVGEAAGGSKSNPRAAAKAFLSDLLTSGPVAKKEIDEAAEANCISATHAGKGRAWCRCKKKRHEGRLDLAVTRTAVCQAIK